MIRDRGKLKWAPASFMPEVFKMQREMYRDQERQSKPILDQYQIEEFEQRICYAMEYNLTVKFSKYEDGFIYEVKGRVHYLDPISKEERLKNEANEVERIKFAEIIGVEVVE